MPSRDAASAKTHLERMRTAVRAAAGKIATNTDPAARARDVGVALEILEAEAATLYRARLNAISELRTSMSYEQIAHVTGLSKSRIAQLARTAAEGVDRSR